MSARPIVRRKPFKEKWTSFSTDPQPLADLLATWQGIAKRMRTYADRQGAQKDYEAAALNTGMAEIIEGLAAELEKSLALYTIEEVEGEPAEEPKRNRRKRSLLLDSLEKDHPPIDPPPPPPSAPSPGSASEVT